jgi:hypothetical protein
MAPERSQDELDLIVADHFAMLIAAASMIAPNASLTAIRSTRSTLNGSTD